MSKNQDIVWHTFDETVNLRHGSMFDFVSPANQRIMTKITLTLVILTISFCAGTAMAEYRLQPGDKVEVSVAGLNDLARESLIDLDGRATFPLVQSLTLGGLTLTEAESKVRERFGSQLFQSRTQDGREIATAVSPNSVTLAITEYRPVYVDGDVSKPGAQTYRPGMTVRQAVSLAGGYEIMRFRMNNPFMESADLASEYQSLWSDHATLEARIWRLNEELRVENKPGKDLILTAPLAASLLEAIRDHAVQELRTRLESATTERKHLEDIVKRSDSQLALLTTRLDADDEGQRADTEDYNKLKDFSSRGQLPITRLSESRRLLLLSTTQALQTRVQIAQVERERSNAEREIGRLDERRRIQILKDIDAATSDLARVKARLSGVSEKMSYTGIIRSQLVRGKGNRPRIRIVHAAPAHTADSGDEDTILEPGDTVEVALETIPEAPGGTRTSSDPVPRQAP